MAVLQQVGVALFARETHLQLPIDQPCAAKGWYVLKPAHGRWDKTLGPSSTCNHLHLHNPEGWYTRSRSRVVRQFGQQVGVVWAITRHRTGTRHANALGTRREGALKEKSAPAHRDLTI